MSGAHDNGCMCAIAAPSLLATLRAELEPHVEIQEAYLFGSWARGEAEPHSDIDVAVYVDASCVPESTFGYAAELTTELSAALGSNAIDLVLLNDAPPVLYHRVLRDGFRIFSRDLSATTSREGHALSRYCDYGPQLEKIDQAHQRRLRRGEFGT